MESSQPPADPSHALNLSHQIVQQQEALQEMLVELGTQRQALVDLIKESRADKAELQAEVSRIDQRVDALQQQQDRQTALLEQQKRLIEQQQTLIEQSRSAQEQAAKPAAPPPPRRREPGFWHGVVEGLTLGRIKPELD